MSDDSRQSSASGAAFRRNPAAFDKSRIKVTNLIENLERTFLPVNSQIGKYRVIEEIDRGGMAVVYKATQTDLDRFVALKVLPANITINRRFVERFLSEAHAVAKLNHPNIVNIHEVSMVNNIYFLAMDYIPGKNLFFYLNHKKPKLVEVLEICIQLADAMAYAHSKKIVHRDLKLNNVIMRDNKTPVLIDFGLAKALGEDEENITKTGEIMGSPAYMAPERILGGYSDSRSDICSLGIMLYEMLTFKNPYLDPRSIHQTTLNVIEADPILPRKLVPWLPVEVEAICLKAMSKEPEDRYQSMEEFRDDLKRYQRGEQVLANPPSLRGRLRYFFKKHWAPLTIAATVALFSSLFGVFFYLQSQREQSRWQLIAQESFADSTALDRWRVWTPAGSPPAAVWKVADQGLRVEAGGYSYVTYTPSFSRDVKFEFDVASLDAVFEDVGFFAYGSAPDSGYGFHLHHRGSALHGLTSPHSDLLFYDYSPLSLAPDSQYHVIIEKTDNAISLTVNDVLIGRLYDYFPRYGRHHQNMGFFVRNGSYVFRNVKIYRRAAPMLANPTIIADRFMAHGEFESALDEYHDLLLDFPAAAFSRAVELKMADCLLRLGRLDEAGRLIDKLDWSKAGEERDRVYNLALKGLLHRSRGDAASAERCFFLLASLFPGHHINQSMLREFLVECERQLAEGNVDSAQQRIVLLASKYRRYGQLCGRFHLKVLDHYYRRPQPDSALATAERIERLYGREEEISMAARVQIGRILLGRRQPAKAMDRLNQCLASHRPTMAVWGAWFTLAQKYESEGNYADALTTYKKVYQECPPGLVLRWQARIKMGELAGLVAYEERSRTIFRQVAAARQPFGLPRLIAAWYSDSLSAADFEAEWSRRTPGNPYYYYHIGRKALLNHDCFSAELVLQDFHRSLPAQSWEALCAARLIGAAESQCKKR